MAKQYDLFLMTKIINAIDGGKDPEIPHKPTFEEIKRNLKNIHPVMSHKPDVLGNELQNFRETLHNVDETLQDFLTKVRKHKEPGKTLKRCYSAAQRIDVCNFKKSNVKKHLVQWSDAIHQTWEKIQDVSISQPEEKDKSPKSPEVEWTSSVFDETKIYGWDKEVELINKDLTRNTEHLNTVGIVGMFGSGKTKLAQKVFASEEVMDRFSLRLWVWVSNCSQERLLRRMLDNLGVEEEEINSALAVDSKLDSVGVLLFLLHLQLLDKRYLIVFDNVCGQIDRWYCNLHVQAPADGEWHRLAHGLPKGSGGAVIVTSRSEDDARKMVGRGAIHTPPPLLKHEDGWKLFEEEYEAAGKKVSPKLEKMKEMIIRKCAGLPFALKVAAREMPPPEKLEKEPADDGEEKGKEPLSLPGEEKEKEAEKETPHHEEEEKHEDDGEEKGKEPLSLSGEEKEKEAEKETPHHEEEEKHEDDEEEKDKETPHPPEEKKDKEAAKKKEEKSADDKKEKGKEPPPPLDEKKDEEAMKKETSPHEIQEEKPKGDEKEKGNEPPSPLEEKKDQEAMQKKETPPHEIQEEKPTGDEKEGGEEPVAEKKDSA